MDYHKILKIKIKSIIVGMKFEVLNSVIQEHRKNSGPTTFTASNGESKTLTFAEFVKDKYIGKADGQISEFKKIKNIRQQTKYNFENRENSDLFTNINQQLLQCYQSAIQSNVKCFLHLHFF